LGSQGGFIAGSRALVELLRNRARAFVFSTGLAPASAGAARAALRLAREQPERRQRLLARARWLRAGLQELGFDGPPGETPILPVIAGPVEAALGLAA